MSSLPIYSLLLLVALCGCSTLGKMGQVMLDPDIQVGKPSDQPSTLGIALVADDTLNQSAEGQASPLELQIVQLAEESRFLASDYDQLRQDLPKALDKNYLDHQDYTLLPGQFRYLPMEPLAPKSRYIGVIAHYADPERSQWRQLIRIQPTGHNYQLLVRLHASSVQLQREEE